MKTETYHETDTPKTYRIRIDGSLDPSWSDRMGGLAITSSGKSGSRTTTVLEGELRDQGALLGVLNSLYELHLVLEALETIPSDPPGPTAEGNDQASKPN